MVHVFLKVMSLYKYYLCGFLLAGLALSEIFNRFNSKVTFVIKEIKLQMAKRVRLKKSLKRFMVLKTKQ